MPFEPDYSSYSLEELLDVESHFDVDRNPERARRLNEAIAARRSGVLPTRSISHTPVQAPRRSEPTARKSKFAYVWIVNSIAMLALVAGATVYLSWEPSDIFAERDAATGLVLEDSPWTKDSRSGTDMLRVITPAAALLSVLTLIGGVGLQRRKAWSLRWLTTLSVAWILCEAGLVATSAILGWTVLGVKGLVAATATMTTHAVVLAVVLLLSRQMLEKEARTAPAESPGTLSRDTPSDA